MNKVHQLPDVIEAEQEASNWIARLHADDVTPEDRARFDAWRAAHPRHARAYEDISATVNEVRRAGHFVRVVSFGNAMEAASRPSDDERTHERGVRSGFSLGIAAAAVLAIVGVMTAWWITRAAPQTLFQTSIGEHAAVDLPDGSRLDLNSNSVARVQYTDHARTIRLLQGEAFFKVAHDIQRPFWVVAGNSWIRAVGTAFNVDLRPSGIRVVVSEGTVKVGARPSDGSPSDVFLAEEPVSIVTAGQQVEMQADTAEIRSVAPTESARVAAWRKGTLYFENQPLETVIDELSRYTSEQIVVADKGLRGLPVGGTFEANSRGVEAFLNTLHEGLGLRVRREDGNRVYIEGVVDSD